MLWLALALVSVSGICTGLAHHYRSRFLAQPHGQVVVCWPLQGHVSSHQLREMSLLVVPPERFRLAPFMCLGVAFALHAFDLLASLQRARAIVYQVMVKCPACLPGRYACRYYQEDVQRESWVLIFLSTIARHPGLGSAGIACSMV